MIVENKQRKLFTRGQRIISEGQIKPCKSLTQEKYSNFQTLIESWSFICKAIPLPDNAVHPPDKRNDRTYARFTAMNFAAHSEITEKAAIVYCRNQ